MIGEERQRLPLWRLPLLQQHRHGGSGSMQMSSHGLRCRAEPMDFRPCTRHEISSVSRECPCQTSGTSSCHANSNGTIASGRARASEQGCNVLSCVHLLAYLALIRLFLGMRPDVPSEMLCLVEGPAANTTDALLFRGLAPSLHVLATEGTRRLMWRWARGW